ncbi:MAG: ACP S-malonyltransferase [Treponema sp.]|jgi:[acyl-carrier-protein] S-malonyltransferase|nr:ACP S-malonyltransferase [Treponema sp.]
MNTIFLFPGQGAQYPGMAMDLLEAGKEIKALIKLASDIIGKDMADMLANSSPDILKRTDVSQPAITLANLAAAAYLAEKGIKPSAAAGFSLGEYAALAVAGVISTEECLLLVNQRGKAMQAAIDKIAETGADAPGMAAVVGLAPDHVETLIAIWKKDGFSDLYAANINSPKQVVVSGSASALGAAEERFKDAGAKRFIRLQVAGPYHSPFMKEAAEAFASSLEKVDFKDPAIPLFSNVTGKQVQTGAEAKSLALRQIVESVRWTDEEKALAALQPDRLLEVGPGKVLQGLWKDSGSETPCLPAGTAEDIGKL